ncbi:MAG: hypothetical protein V7784_09805 [Oceanospirillaceae bacterium]
MPERDDLKVDVPYFGSANQGDTVNNIGGKQQQSGKNPYDTKSSNWVHTILIILLMACVGGMAYWGYDFKQDQEQRELLAAATESRIADLEQLLAESRAQAEKSGQTLQQRLDEQKKQVSAQKKLMDVQYTEYEKKFAQLINNANLKQVEQLASFNEEISKIEKKVKNAQEDAQEEMGFMTSQQKTALTGLEDRLTEIDGIRTNLTNLEISLTATNSVQKGLVNDFEIMNKDLGLTGDKFNIAISEAKKEIAAVDANLEKYKTSAHTSLKSLASKVSVIAKKSAPKLGASVVKRLKETEGAIRAIDGSRAQVNKEIQRLKSKVNKIQLQLQ